MIVNGGHASLCPPYGCHAPRMRGIQYAAASRFSHCSLWNTGSPAFAGDDERRRSRGMFCPSFSKFVCPFPKRGRRECRVRAAPAVSCAICAKESAHEHTGERRTLRHPLRNGFTAYFVLSPVSGLVVTVTSRKTFPQGLMPASRRQDHTTWPYALVQPSAEQKRPSQSRPYVFVAIAKRPSGGPGCATPANDLPDVTSGNIFSRGA
jgi:hypothetical protein